MGAEVGLEVGLGGGGRGAGRGRGRGVLGVCVLGVFVLLAFGGARKARETLARCG